MNSPVLQTKTTTPPDITRSPPLTPPPTEEKERRTSILQILDQVRNLQLGQSSLLPWHKFPLQPDEYRDLLIEVGKESDLIQGFWKHSLKSVHVSLVRLLVADWNIDTITSLRPRRLFFACPALLTNDSSRMSSTN